MTTPIEERLRMVLRDMSDEVRPSPPPVRFQEQVASCVRQRLTLVAAAVVMMVTLAVGAVVLLREPHPEFTDPIVRPPKILKLSESGSTIPGRSLMAVLPASSAELFDGNRVLQLLPENGREAEALRNTRWVEQPYWQHLSWDGTRVIRQRDSAGDPRLEIVNLDTGRTNRLGGRRAYCPALSPDNRTVAAFDNDSLVLLSARDGRILRTGQVVAPAVTSCVSFGWSPDGRLLAVPSEAEQVVTDSDGRVVARLGQRRPVNGSMSWSPDAHSLLLYDADAREYLVKDITGDAETRLTAPPAGLRPMGWVGSRVVWLAGEPGNYRLVTTDRTGADPQTWIRIDAGDRVIEGVQWSRDLIGLPAGDG